MGKYIAYNKLISAKYTDKHGFVGLGIQDSENPHLFTGIAAILLRLNHIFQEEFLDNCRRGLGATQIMPGLYERFPGDAQKSDAHRTSHDEQNGLMFLGAAWNPFRYIAMDTVAYGHANDWMFIEECPGSKIYQPMGDGLPHLINQDNLHRIRQPRDRAFYKIVAGKHPRLHEIISLGISFVLSSRKEPNATSGKIMDFFTIKSLKLLGYKHWFLDICTKIFNKNMIKMYGTKGYLEILMAIYYKDPDHPFHELSQGIRI